MATFVAVGRVVRFYYTFSFIFLLIFSVSNTNSVELGVMEGDEVAEGCNKLLEDFAATVSLYTFCIIRNARPIKLCEKCIEQFLKVKLAHDAILQLEVHGQSCKPELINLDRLEVIESAYTNVVDLWSRGNCNNCFVILNGQITSALNNVTKNFQRLFVETDQCFQDYANKSTIILSPPDQLKNNSATNQVCVKCRKVYCELNDYYELIKEPEGGGEICIDVVDTMNTTRTTWSQSYGCTVTEMQPDLVLILSACVVILFTVTFYILARIYSIKPHSKVMQQTRLAETFSSNSQSPLHSYLQPSTSRVTSR